MALRTRLLPFVLLFPIACYGAHSAGHPGKPPAAYLFTVNLGKSQVTHKLFPVADAKKSPKPFYKRFCKTQRVQAYPFAQGRAVLRYIPKTRRVTFSLAYEGLSGTAIMAHIHIGAVGVGGPIVQTICGNPPPGNKTLGYSALPAVASKRCPRGNSGFLTGSFKLTANQKVSAADTFKKLQHALLSGNLYFNIHTCLNEAGEIRGQIVRLQN